MFKAVSCAVVVLVSCQFYVNEVRADDVAPPVTSDLTSRGSSPPPARYEPWTRTATTERVRYGPYGGTREHDDTQTELLFRGRTTHGGYGAPQIKLTAMLRDPALLVGAHGGWVLDHSFVFGLAGYGLATRHDLPAATEVQGEASTLQLGYGGVRCAYLFRPQRLVHLGIASLLGAGGLVALSKRELPEDDEHGQNELKRRMAHADAFFVFEPEAEAELNVVSFMRVALAISYRLVAAVDAPGLTTKRLSGPAGSVALKFGAF